MTEAFNNAPAVMLEMALSSGNMQRAWQQVRRNKGSAGVDGMTVDAAAPWLHEHWQSVKADILSGRYAPQPVRRVDIPKPDGSKRMPNACWGFRRFLTVFWSQAVAQVLQPVFDPAFSESSYGFRPGRSALSASEGR